MAVEVSSPSLTEELVQKGAWTAMEEALDEEQLPLEPWCFWDFLPCRSSWALSG